MSHPNHSPMFELRKALEDEREVELPMDPAYYDRLHERIMGAVDRQAASPSLKPPAPKPSPKGPQPKAPSPTPGTTSFPDARNSFVAAMARSRSAE